MNAKGELLLDLLLASAIGTGMAWYLVTWLCS
jgi:hypothetical protein